MLIDGDGVNMAKLTKAVKAAVAKVVETLMGPERVYIRRSDSHGRGVGMYPTDGRCASRASVAWTEGLANIPYSAVPAVGDTMTLRFSASEVPGFTLTLSHPTSKGWGSYYRSGARRIVIHTEALPTLPDGMAPKYLVCSLPLTTGAPVVTAPVVTVPVVTVPVVTVPVVTSRLVKKAAR